MGSPRQVGFFIILFIGFYCLLDMTTKPPQEGHMADFRRQREWPIIIQVAREYNLSQEDTVMLLAIRDSELGGKGNEFGVRAVRGTDLKTQAQWAAGSIRANRERYRKLMQEGKWSGSRVEIRLAEEGEEDRPFWVVPPDIDFVDFMAYHAGKTGYGYAPIHAPELSKEEIKLNKNWSRNVRSIMEKHTKTFQERGLK